MWYFWSVIPLVIPSVIPSVIPPVIPSVLPFRSAVLSDLEWLWVIPEWFCVVSSVCARRAVWSDLEWFWVVPEWFWVVRSVSGVVLSVWSGFVWV